MSDYKVEKVLDSLEYGVATYDYHIVNKYGVVVGHIFSEELALLLKEELDW